MWTLTHYNRRSSLGKVGRFGGNAVSGMMAGTALVGGSSTFVAFGPREEILRCLRSIEIYAPSFDPLFDPIVIRIAGHTYDRSAFVFILLELVYDFEGLVSDFGDLLGRLVFALTDDLDLVSEALDAFEEIRQTLEPGSSAMNEPERKAPPALFGSDFDPTLVRETDRERLMTELQLAQKRILDFGLRTRLSIEVALSRPTRDNVGLTLREISELRSNLLHFEALLRGSEERILEAIGVFDRG